MEYNSYSSRGLAFEPFPVERDYVYKHYDSLTNDLCKENSCFNEFDIPTDIVINESLFDDVDVDFFINKYHPLDFLVDNENNMAWKGDDQLSSGSDDSTLGSPKSPFSLDDFSFDLLAPIDINEINNDKNVTFTTHDTVAKLTTPTSPLGEVSSQFLVSSSSVQLLTSQHVIPDAVIEHKYAKSIDSDNECLELLSPKSVDSGISTTFSDVNCPVDDFLSDLWNNLDSPSNDSGDAGDAPESQEASSTKPDYGTSTSDNLRYRPYVKRQKPEERKIRKKEHNRKSATKYRKKKKEELETVFSEVDVLEKKNAELKVKADELEREVSYLKGLVLDIFKTRLSLKNGVDMESLMSSISSKSH